MVDAINHALSEELERNDKMVIYGQDIAGGKGGVFTATKNLTDKFTENRVFNSPLAESSIIGTAIGMATLGYKPVVEIQFADYIWYGMMQIRNELATMYYRSNGNWSCPVVVRVPVGGYIHGSLCHSQSIDGYFIGPYDLSASLGSPGNFKTKEFIDAEKKILAAAKDANIKCGYHLVEPVVEEIEKLMNGDASGRVNR